jgi:tRNA nucleotidyltransferase (CCA-adding enzyme)
MPRKLHPIPTVDELSTWLGEDLIALCREIGAAGGRAWLVGGAVRDLLRGEQSDELDFEVRGVGLEGLRAALGRHGEVMEVGRAFGVLRLRHIDVDFALPRRDSKEGRGHRGIHAEIDPYLDPVIAAQRRDLTVNAMSLDPLTGELYDPLGGVDHLRAGVLKACDPATFGEDPLRALRVMQLAARLEMEPDEELTATCARQDLSELSAERIFNEFRKLLLMAREPSRGLRFLENASLLRFFPELEAMIGVPQDPLWHPEGDVWVHTLMVVDAAAALRDGGEDDLTLMFAALLHDLGKPATTVTGDDGRIRSPQHDLIGERLATEFLSAMRSPNEITAKVRSLTREHLAPAVLIQQNSSDRALRRLARRLWRTGTSMELLARLARADHLGRTTEEARRGEFEAGDEFLVRARALEIDHEVPPDVVQGRHLLALGMKPGREIGEILDKCRAVQDETGWTDPEQILEHVMGQQ